MASYDLGGKVCLVTGAARGIGFATAESMIRRGASVVVVDLDQAACDAAAERLHASRAIGLAADVTDRGSLQRVVAQAVERFGGIDVVVANAGIASAPATFRATSSETFDRIIDVNLLGVARTVQATLPQIVERGGHVVVVASVYAFLNGMGASAYAMSKAGVEQLGRALRIELQQYGASASVAYFGFIDTEMVHQALDADPLAGKLMQVLPGPLKKRLPPQEAGEAIVQGIEKRAPRIIRPKRWAAMSVLRGIVNPLSDRAFEKDRRALEAARAFDGRAGQDQPTTA